MHFRRLACLLLGVWLGGNAVVALLAATGGAAGLRAVSDAWGIAQIALGAAVLFVLLFGTHEGKFPLLISFLMLVWAGLERFALRDAHPWPSAANAALALILAGRLLVRRRRSGDARLEVDVIDVGDHRHVDR